MPTSILVFAAHPDDAEIFMGGSIAWWIEQGNKVIICDLTQGESATNGDVHTRKKESRKASHILGINDRCNLFLPDGDIQNEPSTRIKIIDTIRKYQPHFVFTMAPENRHPDHSQTHYLIKDSVFKAGLKSLKTHFPAHKPLNWFWYPEHIITRRPDFVVDIEPVLAKKISAIEAYDSQVCSFKEFSSENLNNNETSSQKKIGRTFIKSKIFWNQLIARQHTAASWSHIKIAEAFFSGSVPVINDLASSFIPNREI